MRTPLVHTRRRHPDEGGFSIIEVVVALGLFALIITGLAASNFNGLELISTSDTRQISTQIANAEVDVLRNRPFDSVGMDNSFITSIPSTYLPPGCPGGAGCPALPEDVVFVAGGPVQPTGTVTVRAKTFSVTRRVTWANSPVQAGPDEKRVTVMVQWGRQDGGNASPTVVSSIFSKGSVSWSAP